MYRLIQRTIVVAAAIGIPGCSSSATAADQSVPLALSRAPDFTAVVTRATNESGYTPEGYASQYDIWVAITPAMAANAGVVVGTSTPVFVSTNGTVASATAASIMAGDVVQIWRSATVAYGAVEAPTGAPAYAGTQVVIMR